MGEDIELILVNQLQFYMRFCQISVSYIYIISMYVVYVLEIYYIVNNLENVFIFILKIGFGRNCECI